MVAGDITRDDGAVELLVLVKPWAVENYAVALAVTRVANRPRLGRRPHVAVDPQSDIRRPRRAVLAGLCIGMARYKHILTVPQPLWIGATARSERTVRPVILVYQGYPGDAMFDVPVHLATLCVYIW